MNYKDLHKAAQYAELDLLLELDRICRNNTIPYILVGGSMLGAVRHQGFIPWDDDIDVGMLRSDYERFVHICRSELSNEYKIVTSDTDKEYPHFFAKLIIPDTIFIEEESEETGMCHSVFIDIFPYDNVPSHKLQQKKQGFTILLYRKILQLKLGWNLGLRKGLDKRVVYKILRVFSILLPVEGWKKQINKAVHQYDNVNSRYAVSLSGDYGYDRETMPKTLFEHRMEIDFEQYKFFIPQDYNYYLSRIYGNYMELPPVEQRKSKHLIKIINLKKYQIKNMHKSEVEQEI